jgi:ribulose-bisphosphate carboxylase small chain
MKSGTFSYLPPMTPQQVRQQVEYVLERGWSPAIEYTEAGRAAGSFWSMWRLPMFGETSAERVLAEAEACRKANPGHVVRVIGYDNLRQTLGAAFTVHHA